MDIYGLMCIFYLVLNCIWHAVVCVLVFIFTPNFFSTPDMWLTNLDRIIFFVSIGIFILAHFVLIGWVFFVPLKLRRQIAKKDIEYRSLLSTKTNRRNGESIKQKLKGSSNYERIPIE
jgi:hypothetical protein